MKKLTISLSNLVSLLSRRGVNLTYSENITTKKESTTREQKRGK